MNIMRYIVVPILTILYIIWTYFSAPNIIASKFYFPSMELYSQWWCVVHLAVIIVIVLLLIIKYW